MSTSVASLPRRLTEAKQQEMVSRHQFAERLIQFGWMPLVPEDLGEDFIVHVYFQGRATGVVFHVQVKSISDLLQRRRGEFVAYHDFKVKDLKHWASFDLPVVLVVWDVRMREGCWMLVRDAITDLNRRRPEWRNGDGKATVHFPWQNITDEQGLIQLRRTLGQSLMPLLVNGKQLEFTLTLTGDAAKDPAQMQQVIGDWIHTGGELSSEQIRKVRLQFGPPEFGRWIGDLEFETFCLTADPPVRKHRVQLTVLDDNGQSLAKQQIEVQRRHTIDSGQHYVEFDSIVLSEPIGIRLTVPITNIDPLDVGPCEFSWHVQNWGQDAADALEIARFWKAWDGGQRLRLDFDGEGGRLEFALPTHAANDNIARIELRMQQLCLLQHRLGQRFQVPVEGPSKENMDAIAMLAAIVERGKIESVTPGAVIKAEGTFSASGLQKLVDLYESHEDADFHVSGVFGTINLFGHAIELGSATRHIYGKIDSLPQDIGDLIRRAPVETSLRIGLVEATMIDIYPAWFMREAERLAHLLVEKIGIDVVYLFGSVAWGGEYAPDTDIDLAVRDLDAARLLEAIDLIAKWSDFPVDLVDIDRVTDQLRERIIKSGIILNGSK